MALPIVPEWSLGDRLRKARILAGLTVEQLAVAMGTTAKTVNKYEHDRIQRPSGFLVAKWAEVTGADSDWLLAGFLRRFTSLNPQLSLFDDDEVIDLTDHATVHPLRRASDHPNEVGHPHHLDAVSGF